MSRLCAPLSASLTFDVRRTHVGVFLSGKGRQTTSLYITFKSISARDRLDLGSVQRKVTPYLDEGPPPGRRGGWGSGSGGGGWGSYHNKKGR